MARALVLRATASYQVQIQRKIAVRPYFGSDTTNGNKWLFKKHTDFEKRIKDGENLKLKGIWAKVIEKKNQYFRVATALATGTVAYFLKASLYPTTKYIDERFEEFKTRLSKENGSWITPTLEVKSLSHDEVKYLVPMPGMKLDECSYEWDVEGLSLTIRGDNEEHEFRYTPNVPRRFRHGKVTFDSLAKGHLLVSVKARGYHNPHTQTQPDIPNEQNFSDLTRTKISHEAHNNLGLKFLAFDEAIAQLDIFGEDSYKDNTLPCNFSVTTSLCGHPDEVDDEIKESLNPEETK